ncbi:hypothetical protein CDIK_0953 [Cucumispora dikerogammari]|nr:hypothetical protein CDIK_0953 [Cucumispora dikerogammari]
MIDDKPTNNNYFESFIFPYKKPENQHLPTINEIKNIEINEDDTDLVYLQKLCTALNCTPFESKFFDFKNHYVELINFLKEYSRTISRFGFKLDLSDLENTPSNLKTSLNTDELEIKVEKLYPLFCKMSIASKANIAEMRMEINKLENAKKIINFEKYKNAYEKLTKRENDANLQKTKAFQHFKNRKIIRVLEEAIINRNINNNPLKIALKHIVKHKKMKIDELETIMGLDKLSTIKLIFILKNKKFINFDQDNEIICPWTSNF